MDNSREFGLFTNGLTMRSKLKINKPSSDIDSDQDIRQVIHKQQTQANIKIAESASRHLLEDSKVFDYDECYDEIKQTAMTNSRPTCNDRDKSLPKYRDDIIKAASRRKMFHEIAKENLEKKKQSREPVQSETPKYITKNYEDYLRDKKKLYLQDELEELVSHHTEITQMEEFYSNLLTKNSCYAGGLRGEGDIAKLDLYNKRKKEYSQLITNTVDSILLKESSGSNKPTKSEINVHELLERKEELRMQHEKIEQHNLLSQELDRQKQEEINSRQDKLNEYKKRFLDRKRNRQAD